VTGVGDAAIFLHGIDESRKILDHGALLKKSALPSLQIKTARSTGLFSGVLEGDVGGNVW
jgi:hypothetical protein